MFLETKQNTRQQPKMSKKSKEKKDGTIRMHWVDTKIWFQVLPGGKTNSGFWLSIQHNIVQNKKPHRDLEKKITLCSLKSSPSKTKEHGINKVCRSNEGENIMSEMPVCQQNLCSIITAAGCWETGTDGTLKVLWVYFLCFYGMVYLLCSLFWRSQVF